MRTRSKAARLGLVLTLSALCACDRAPQTAAQNATPVDVPEQATTEQTTPSPPAVVLPGGQSIADVAAKVTPSVVTLFSERTIARPSGGEWSRFLPDPFFPFFLDPPGGRYREAPRPRERSLGSGVIVSEDGIIVTNSHVISQADEIRVVLKDGRELDAKLVGSDPKSDVAVLRVDAKDLPAIPMADSSKIRIGDVVLAIGNPFGIGQTVTMGIISAVGRANLGINDYEELIQTDAAINPGNSGGALVTMDGRLVGINTAIFSRSGGHEGIGFAIPSKMVMQVKDAILQHGKVLRGWLGVAIQDVTPPLAESLTLSARSGALVSDVTPASPAAKAGLERGDVISAVDGVKIEDSAHLRNVVAMAGRGKRVTVEVLRDGKEKSLEVTLGELPAEPSRGPEVPTVEETGIFSGVTVQELDDVARSRSQIPSRIRGVVVTRVHPESPAADMGLRAGDVIVEINRKATPSVDAFRKATKESDRRALALVYRDGATIFMALSR